MQPSIAGILIFCGLLAVSRFFAMPAVVALIASLTFGTTAIVVLPALGGSSPMVFVALLAVLLLVVALRRDTLSNLQEVFAHQPIAQLVLLLMAYTAATAFLLPRLFAGRATVFIPQRTAGEVIGIVQTTLGPVSGNVTQPLYFIFGGFAFFAFSVVLLRPGAIKGIRQGFFIWATLNVAAGFIDLFGKILGLADILAPIRSASYAMATNVEVAGFFRIAGTYSEASAFGAVSVALLAFMFTYWRQTRNTYALVLSAMLCILLTLSTSTTAYVSTAILGAILFVSLVREGLRDKLQRGELALLGFGIAVIVAAIGAEAYDARLLAPLWDLFDAMVFNKASSSSGYERAYWNYQSLVSVYDTMGLGIGLGSSRASSWVIAVVSQLGLIGAAMMGVLTWEIIRSNRIRYAAGVEQSDRATVLSVRAAALASLLAATIGGGAADPGLVFFIALAVASAVSRTISVYRGAAVPAPSLA